ncbi:hypothetical protein [Yinghuangia sp. YIM S09857]|uniref:hypothetical protein n=1 Tax=Yinghuangia sp. YIM S09857 TaxID=3436929 RepID=UPI003F532CFE
MRAHLVRGLVAATLTLGALAGASAVAGAAAPGVPAASASAPDLARGACDARDNLGEVANNFISRCRKAGIRQRFPGEHYGDKLGYLMKCRTESCNRAWKLLQDGRWKK